MLAGRLADEGILSPPSAVQSILQEEFTLKSSRFLAEVRKVFIQ